MVRDGLSDKVTLDVFSHLIFLQTLYLAWLVYTEGSREVSSMGVQRKRERKEKVQSTWPGSASKFEGQQEGQ